MRVAIAAVSFAALAGTEIKEAAGAGSLVTQTRYVRGYRKCDRQLVIGPYVCRRYWL